MQAQHVEHLDLNESNDAQYHFLKPILNNVEVVSLAESIHYTHEFRIARLGVVRWINQNSGYGVLAFEGSPEDVWVSQDAFLGNSNDLYDSTSGLFALWNTDEMRAVFAYERDSWRSDHPLYITAYDIQPGTGKGSSGARVFALLYERLAHYASPSDTFHAADWEAALTPLTGACYAYKPSDEEKAVQAINVLEQWIAMAAPKVEAAYPGLPMHADALRLIPQNLRKSLALCQAVGGNQDGQRNWGTYKQIRDQLAAQYALTLKAASPNQKLILWAHLSHLFYNSEGKSTSVGEILHQTLGPRLYTIGNFALGGGTIVLFSDVNEDFGYTFITGVSKAIKKFLAQSCKDACFTDLRSLPEDSPLAGSQRLWVEASRQTLPLAKDFDGAIWVNDVHPPKLRLPLLLILSGKHYVKPAAGLFLGFLILLLFWFGYMRRTYNRFKI